jgi:hypothetical protein
MTRRLFSKLLDELSDRDTVSFDPLPVGLPPNPLVAATPQLAACLKLLHGRPLKLVAEARHDDERPWITPLWTFQVRDGHVAVKDLLELPADRSQFSVANENSRQQSHKHLNVFELYISAFPMDVQYRQADGTPETLTVECGAMLVPPTVEHHVVLHGLTFVVQCATPEHRVGTDKVATVTV